jgi:putative ABC transport system permease protein
MRAIGASRRQMIGSVLVEATAIGLLASVLGLGAGFGVGRLLAYLFTSLGGGGLALAGVTLPAPAVISAFAVGLVVTMAAAVLPAMRASRIPPMAALQEVATPDRPLTKLSVGGAVITAAGGTVLGLGLAGRLGDATPTLWGVLGGALAVFLGVALLTPLISRPVVAGLGRLTGRWVPGVLGRRNAGRNPRRTGITAAALMIGVALVTAVGVVLQSATVSFTQSTEDTINAELYIGGEQMSDRPPSFDAAVLDRAEQVPGVAEVLGVWRERATHDGGHAPVYAWHNPGALRDIFGVTAVEGSIDSLSPTQLLVDDKLAAAMNLHTGSTITLAMTRGEPTTFTVAGVYTEVDGYVQGLIVSDTLRAQFAIPQPQEAFVKLAPGATVAGTLPALRALLTDSPEVDAVDRATMISRDVGEVDTLLRMVQILLSLAILIAALGIINTLTLSVLERTRELGLLRAVGLGRAHTTAMVTVEAVVISVFGALLGMGVGIGLGAAAVRAFRDDGFTTLSLPWSDLGLYVGVAALIGVVAGLLASIRAVRINVLGASGHV